MDRKTKINICYIIAAFLIFMLVQSFYQSSNQYTAIPYAARPGQDRSGLDRAEHNSSGT
jgi:hypothetical protein